MQGIGHYHHLEKQWVNSTYCRRRKPTCSVEHSLGLDWKSQWSSKSPINQQVVEHLGGKNNTNVRASEKNQGGYYPVTSDWRENGGQLFVLQFWEPYNTNVGWKQKLDSA